MKDSFLAERPSPIQRFTNFFRMAILGVPIFIVILFLLLPGYVWFYCRIEPGASEIAVLIRKTGKDIPSGQILALEPGQKGIQLEVLSAGRYFRNPFTWDWKIEPITEVPAGKVGVLTRLYGKDLPPGEIKAGPDTKGIVPDVLNIGTHRINPYAYRVDLFDAINIHPGNVGVVVSLEGHDILNSDEAKEVRNSFLVEPGMKGVLAAVYNPGTYYLNPYLFNVVEITLQSQRFAMSGDDAISFLTQDGFTVLVEGTIEFAVDREKAALLTHRVGDMNDIIQKLIMPKMRGFCRIEGSKHPATNFIVGETRQKFQSDLDQHLREKCNEWGVLIKSVLIRNIIPPDEIASIIRDREVAVQESRKYDQEIAQAQSKAELVKQEMLALQNKEKVEADTIRIRAVINAEQDQSVKVVAARKEMEVAQIESESAMFQAESIILKAKGDGDVIKLQNQAEANVIKSQVKAFGTGLNLARWSFYQKIGPQITSIVTSDEEPGLGGLFGPFLPTKEVRP